MHEVEEQRALGRAARKHLPRSAHGDWTPAADRDVTSIVRKTEAERVPELIPIRRQRMTESPFGFFRGATAVMAHDLSRRASTGLEVRICGDAHVRNMGAYASPEGHLVFDINDFDETIRAPFEWDVLRFATSLVLAGWEAGDSDCCCTESVAALVRCYRESMTKFAKLPFVELLRVDVKRMLSAKPIDLVLRKAERATAATLLKKLTSGKQFRDEPPLLRRLCGEDAEKVTASLDDYERTLTDDRRFALRHYRPIDVAFKVVGTGSVGVNDYVILFAGAAADDVLFLQIKEEPHSCYAPYIASDAMHNGRRVAEGQRLVQRTSDPFLGWTSIGGKDYFVRQLNDHKAAVDSKDLKGKSLVRFAEVAGTVLARGHARTGDAAAIAAYCGKSDNLDRAVARFAIAYAKQTVEDHLQFVRACAG